MIRHFLKLEWKQFFRSAYWQKNVATNIMLVFFGLYLMVVFLSLGFFMTKALDQMFPDSDPFLVFNNFIFYYILGDLLVRFFFQKLPVMTVKPLLTLPVKRRSVVNFVLGKSALSFFNFLPLFFLIPFGISLIGEGQDPTVIVVWIIALFLISMINNFLNFIIESISAETELPFLPIVLFAGGLYALDNFGILNLSELVGNAILYISNNPIWILSLVGILLLLYAWNHKILTAKLYIDNSLQSKRSKAKTSNLAWTRIFGDVAPFMQLDLKLIMRNKRTKSSVFTIAIGLLYGLFFYPQEIYQGMDWFFIFIGIFSTGIFLISFGQFIPAWDSSYYKLLMSQNVQYKDYLKSKFTLMILSVGVMFVLGIPYVYFGWKILLAHFAAAIYNIGVNSHVILWGGSFNRKKIELDQRAAFNFQGTGAVQWLIGIPLMIIPLILFVILNLILGFEWAIGIVLIIGLTGIVLHHRLLDAITARYKNTKHKMIEAFSQDT